jgi:hypothetical protein
VPDLSNAFLHVTDDLRATHPGLSQNQAITVWSMSSFVLGLAYLSIWTVAWYAAGALRRRVERRWGTKTFPRVDRAVDIVVLVLQLLAVIAPLAVVIWIFTVSA